MASYHNDVCYWLGQPINAMTREQLQDALIECKLALMLKENEVIKLRHFLEYENEIASGRHSNAVHLRSIS